MILLGAALYMMIAGPGNDSIRGHLKGVWNKQANEQQELYP